MSSFVDREWKQAIVTKQMSHGTIVISNSQSSFSVKCRYFKLLKSYLLWLHLVQCIQLL